MPKIVDHDARRRQVAARAVEIVATEGIDALTTRSVAGAAGYSTAVVSHYFEGKDDLLLATFRLASDRARDRFVAAVDAAVPDQRLARGLEALLPTSEEARQEWSVFLAFWGKAIALPELAAEQAARVRSASSRVARLMEVGPGAGVPRGRRADVARQLLVAVQGISTYAVFDPQEWGPQRQRRMLRTQLLN